MPSWASVTSENGTPLLQELPSEAVPLPHRGDAQRELTENSSFRVRVDRPAPQQQQEQEKEMTGFVVKCCPWAWCS